MEARYRRFVDGKGLMSRHSRPNSPIAAKCYQFATKILTEQGGGCSVGEQPKTLPVRAWRWCNRLLHYCRILSRVLERNVSLMLRFELWLFCAFKTHMTLATWLGPLRRFVVAHPVGR
jgi:hypothetical protein